MFISLLLVKISVKAHKRGSRDKKELESNVVVIKIRGRCEIRDSKFEDETRFEASENRNFEAEEFF